MVTVMALYHLWDRMKLELTKKVYFKICIRNFDLPHGNLSAPFNFVFHSRVSAN